MTIKDVKEATEVIWGQSVLKMKGDTVGGTASMWRKVLSRFPRSSSSSNKMLNGQLIVSMSTNTFSSPPTALRYALVTHLAYHTKALISEALHATYKMYLLHGFQIVVNIRFLKEKIRSLCHSLPFERMPGIMAVLMVLYIVKFVNGFP